METGPCGSQVNIDSVTLIRLNQDDLLPFQLTKEPKEKSDFFQKLRRDSVYGFKLSEHRVPFFVIGPDTC